MECRSGSRNSPLLSETFSQPPATDTLWLTNEVQSAIHSVLEHDYPAARLRYWRDGQRTAWVLEEIGKRNAYYGRHQCQQRCRGTGINFGPIAKAVAGK